MWTLVCSAVCLPLYVCVCLPCSLLARVSHVALTTVMMKTVTSLVYDLLYRK